MNHDPTTSDPPVRAFEEERIRCYRPIVKGVGATLWLYCESADKKPRCGPGWEYAEFVRVT